MALPQEPNDPFEAVPPPPELPEDEARDEGRDERVPVTFDSVLLTATRGQHPDSGSLAAGYMGRQDEVKPHIIIHRKSDGKVVVKHKDNSAGGELVVLALGMFESGYNNYRAWSTAEEDALQEELAKLVESGALAEGYELYGEYGLETGPGGKPKRAKRKAVAEPVEPAVLTED